MKPLDFIILIRKHIIILITVPLLLAGLVILLTARPRFFYTSQTVLYTGLATGSSIEVDKTFNYFVTNTAFDNLINIINSRETQQEIAIRLLSQHLLLGKSDPKYISENSFQELKRIAAPDINRYVVKKFRGNDSASSGHQDTIQGKANRTDSSGRAGVKNLFPPSVNKDDYEMTVRNLTDLMKSSDTNFVYKLLNYNHPHYSIRAISSIKVTRIGNSDLIRLSYETDDPGICQQTLALFNEVCIKNYKNIRENRSDDVVRYFETQLSIANQQLKSAEDKLLAFNKSNNIINYYEQSKAVAVVKEDMEVDYSNKKAQLAGHEAAIRRLEEKLNIQQLVQLKSSSVLDKKKQLGEINYAIANAEADAGTDEAGKKNLQALRNQAERLKNDIKKSVDDLYAYQNSTDGLPVSKVLSEWINNVVEAEGLRAKLMVMDQRNKEFQQQYSVYAPAGAQIKRIEREISVSEQGYLEILHGLNLAKLKLQDNELASNLKEVDPPYYPISPVPTKRKLLVIGTVLLGLLLIIGLLLAMEYFDETLRNLKKAANKLKLSPLGMISKVYLRPGIEDFVSIQKRSVEMISQNIIQTLEAAEPVRYPKIVVLFSTREKEGKSVVTGNVIKELLQQGRKCIFINFSGSTGAIKISKPIFFLSRLLGYTDPRVDDKSVFLQNPADYLPANTIYNRSCDEQDLGFDDYTELLQKCRINIEFIPDYIFIELPSLLKNNYPAGMVKAADLSILICRSNRDWTDADQASLDNFMKLTSAKTNFILNGVELQELESLIGELPKKRSILRKKVKNLFRLQVFSGSQF